MGIAGFQACTAQRTFNPVFADRVRAVEPDPFAFELADTGDAAVLQHDERALVVTLVGFYHRRHGAHVKPYACRRHHGRQADRACF